jgi:hypothetical protein
LALGVVVALQVLAVEWSSLRTLFETADLDLAQWGIVVRGRCARRRRRGAATDSAPVRNRSLGDAEQPLKSDLA